MHDIFQQITQQIIAALEAGTATYRMPWHRAQQIGAPRNAIRGRTYRGINSLLLWAEAERKGYRSGSWATYRQWTARGGQVRAGERATLVLLWKPIPAHADATDQVKPEPGRLVARAFRVFNADQVDGIPTTEPDPLPEAARIGAAESFFAAIPAEIWQGSDEAFYDLRADLVSMPSFTAFRSAEAYYSVLGHELIHWSGAQTRLYRDLTGRFGSEAYAMEELISELGTAFLGGHLHLATEPRTDHAPYIASWLRVLKSDPRAIVTAASRAQTAADYLIALAESGVHPTEQPTALPDQAQPAIAA